MKNVSAVITKSNTLIKALSALQHTFYPVMQYPSAEKLTVFDFSNANTSLRTIEIEDTLQFNTFIQQMLQQRNAIMGVGGYLEHRIIYRRSNLFRGNENRCIHLGVDIWAPAFSPVYAPLAGTVHSYKDNAGFGDYGPTVILEHQLENCRFYTLYGHLSRQSLQQIRVGQKISGEEKFTELGPFPENGNWPPHLHFQIIMDLEGRSGDFPGVASPADLEKYKILCPDPNLILRLPSSS